MVKLTMLNKTPSQPSAPPFDATDVTPKEAKTDSGRAARIGLWTLGLGFGGFLLWAGLAPLDEGVPGPGQVVIDTKSKAVQHLSGGLVKEVLVGEGDRVKEGQLLVRLDAGVARANFEATRQRYLNLRATESRLQAEQRGLSKISFHPDVVSQPGSPDPSGRPQSGAVV